MGHSEARKSRIQVSGKAKARVEFRSLRLQNSEVIVVATVIAILFLPLIGVLLILVMLI